MRHAIWITAASALLVTGCLHDGQQTPSPTFDDSSAVYSERIEDPSISGVVDHIRAELQAFDFAIFMAGVDEVDLERFRRDGQGETANIQAAQPARHGPCPYFSSPDNLYQGGVLEGLVISQVGIEMGLTETRTSSGEGSVEFGGGLTVGVSGSGSGQTANTSTLKLSFAPSAREEVIDQARSDRAMRDRMVDYELARRDGDQQRLGLSDYLLNYVQELSELSTDAPCLLPVSGAGENDEKPLTQELVINFSITNKLTAGGSLDFFIFEIGGERSTQLQQSNKLTVQFSTTPPSPPAAANAGTGGAESTN